METKEFKFLTKKRIWSLITVIIMIFNLFSPYGVLTHNSYAAEKKPLERRTILYIRIDAN